jgi:putative ABC transport system permease protein
MRIFLSRIWGLFRGRRPDDELNHEVGFHLAMLEDEFRARGFTDSEAKRAARREFGGVTQIQEEYRERSGIRWLEVAVKDVRFGVRILAKKPGFTLIAILALALGIGPNTALFSIVYAAFFDSIGYPDPDRLVTVEYQGKGGGANRLGIAPGDFLEFQRENAVFETLSALRGFGGVYSSGEMEQLVRIASATLGYVSRTCGLQPLLGRDFFPEEAEPGNDRVVILSHRFWDATFGKDPAIVGQKIRLNAKLYTVIGVMPPSKEFGGNEFQMLVPGKPDPRAYPQHGQPGPYVWGRLKTGVSLAQATAEMNRVAQNLAREYPATNQGLSIKIEPVRNSWVPARTKTTIWLLAGAVAFVLLIACANLASLMLARGTTRQREIAIRASLGASGGRLFVQLLIESLIIAGAGCALGVDSDGFFFTFSSPRCPRPR